MKQNNKAMTGKLVEAAGQIVGEVIDENEKTLLIRKAELHSTELVLYPKATFFKKDELLNDYWLNFIDKASVVTVPTNCIYARNFVSELLNM